MTGDNPSSSPLKILLADDHALVREGVAVLIDREPDMCVVGQASGGHEVLALAPKLRPDIAVVDLSMPDMSVQALEQLRATCATVRAIALTRLADGVYLDRMWSIGVRGYVMKRATIEDLIKAIRAVAKGNTYIDPDIADRFREDVLGRRKHVTASGATLTGREREVLALVAWGYSNAEIARRLAISVKTVEFYRACAVQKLNLRGRREIVIYAMRQGWINEDNVPE